MGDTMIRKECQVNFETFMRAAKNKDVSLVSCKDSKGRDFQVLCILVDVEETGGNAYIPFGLMVTPALYPLMNKIEPPENLQGEWMWEL